MAVVDVFFLHLTTALNSFIKNVYHVNFEIDLNKISANNFKQMLLEKKLHPGRQIILTAIDEVFNTLERKSIKTLSELIAALKSKSGIQKFNKETSIDIEYLTQLSREAKSYITKVVRLEAFPGFFIDGINKLHSTGLKNSKQLWEKVDKIGADGMASETSVPVPVVEELYCLCDLSRIWGVGPVFARIVFEAGTTSVRDFAAADGTLSPKLSGWSIVNKRFT